MKPRYSTAITLALVALSPAIGGEAAVAAEAKLRPTHEQLSQRKNAERPATRGAAKIIPVEPGVVQKRERKASSLISRSTVLSFGGFWTIVPKEAVLHVPSNYRARLAERPKGRLLTWQDFYTRNRGWIHAQNVTLSDARGDTELPVATVDAFRRTGRVVVAICHQGPISMKKPAAKTAAQESTATNS